MVQMEDVKMEVVKMQGDQAVVMGIQSGLMRIAELLSDTVNLTRRKFEIVKENGKGNHSEGQESKDHGDPLQRTPATVDRKTANGEFWPSSAAVTCSSKCYVCSNN